MNWLHTEGEIPLGRTRANLDTTVIASVSRTPVPVTVGTTIGSSKTGRRGLGSIPPDWPSKGHSSSARTAITRTNWGYSNWTIGRWPCMPWVEASSSKNAVSVRCTTPQTDWLRVPTLSRVAGTFSASDANRCNPASSSISDLQSHSKDRANKLLANEYVESCTTLIFLKLNHTKGLI